MKQNMLEQMAKLEIDEGMRDLVRQLWKHNYRTLYSCEGHGLHPAYVSLKQSGDGWFEENAIKYGLEKSENHDCCSWEILEFDKTCMYCGAGVNGYDMYRGELNPNPFAPIRPY